MLHIAFTPDVSALFDVVLIIAYSVPLGDDYVAALSFSSATTLSREDDGVSAPILKRAGFPIGGALQYYAYVSCYEFRARIAATCTTLKSKFTSKGVGSVYYIHRNSFYRGKKVPL